MKIYIVLFRGINVGGRHTLPMKELVALLEDLGLGSGKNPGRDRSFGGGACASRSGTLSGAGGDQRGAPRRGPDR